MDGEIDRRAPGSNPGGDSFCPGTDEVWDLSPDQSKPAALLVRLMEGKKNMKVQVNEKGNSKVAIIESSEVIINGVQDALDVMATVRHMYDCDKMVISKAAVSESFFDLKTGLAGEILQKYVNYNMKVAVVGNFADYASKSLKDFIYESNQGSQAFFLDNEKEAVARLHGIEK